MKGKRNFIKVGGWMKYKKSGFTILESIIYIFLSTMIIAEGLNLFMPMYKTYLEIKNKSIRSNEYENFYINLNNIISEGAIDNIVIGNDYMTLCKSEFGDNLKKTIRVHDKKIVVVYSRGDEILTYNNMLFNIEKIEINKKENLIYMKIYDENGDKYICSV
ncbi:MULTISPECIES: hypothetical protein [Clostridium]|nr:MULTISPECIES: hypothetical protein [Clostridium]MDU1230302.1 hypothetical protein [Clostridium sp.]MDU5102880.1 hypothetical protein [Clostridium butyricum]